MKLKLGFSPCPNDTYMLFALLHPEALVHDFHFEQHILDVEELNQAAKIGAMDITKLSFRTFFDVCDDYDLLSSGAALGRGNGPLLICKSAINLDDIESLRIGVPGLHTTATFLLQFAFPRVHRLVPMLFSDIEAALAGDQIDVGVIIHETRFLYAKRGFHLLADLGEIWENQTGSPIPLGGFAVRRDLEKVYKAQLSELIRRSIIFADEHYEQVLPFIKRYAQELDEVVIRSHVDMFVNTYSKSLGAEGIAAIQAMFAVINEKNNTYKQFSVV